jgi:AbrB family looped-hinge helix DNA binding protein
MKLVCSQAELNASLQLVSRAVASRPTHPVLANVLLTADAGTGRLSLTGFDLSLGIQTSLAASVQTSGAITLPAALRAALGIGPGSQIRFELRGRELIIRPELPITAYYGLLEGHDLGDTEPAKEPDREFE